MSSLNPWCPICYKHTVTMIWSDDCPAMVGCFGCGYRMHKDGNTVDQDVKAHNEATWKLSEEKHELVWGAWVTAWGRRIFRNQTLRDKLFWKWCEKEGLA
jgi:uncharacterized metal-binding protein (TIGR02443 family)